LHDVDPDDVVTVTMTTTQGCPATLYLCGKAPRKRRAQKFNALLHRPAPMTAS
jgi:metal-sulfur cluster biosynthetic enzyme